tara:strand:- start:208 stop:516 length:309 start_codon:yes stop_codon:yes gene_type:complete
MESYKDLAKAKFTCESSGYTVSKKSKASKPSKSTEYGKCETVAQANKKAPEGVLFMANTIKQATEANFSKSNGKLLKCQTCGKFASNWKCLKAHWQNQKGKQ